MPKEQLEKVTGQLDSLIAGLRGVVSTESGSNQLEADTQAVNALVLMRQSLDGHSIVSNGEYPVHTAYISRTQGRII